MVVSDLRKVCTYKERGINPFFQWDWNTQSQYSGGIRKHMPWTVRPLDCPSANVNLCFYGCHLNNMSTARSLLLLKYLRTPKRVSDTLSDPFSSQFECVLPWIVAGPVLRLPGDVHPSDD